MKLTFFAFLLTTYVVNSETKASNAVSMNGEFKRCVDGVCDIVKELFFEANECFKNNNEQGISFFVNNKQFAGQFTPDYEILGTNCTIKATEQAIWLWNFINDKYDIIYLIIIAAAKIVIGVLAYLLCKLRKSKPALCKEAPSALSGSTELTEIAKHHFIQPSAPSELDKESNIPDVKKSMFNSTLNVESETKNIYPTQYSTSLSLNASSIHSYSYSKFCTCHKAQIVCSNC